MKHLLLSIAAMLALAAAGCGSNDKSYGGQPAASAAATAPAPTVAPTPDLAKLSAGALAGAPGGSAQPRVNGVVAGVDGQTVKLQDGTSFTLAPNARISRLQQIKYSDLAKDQFVAITAKRQPDNTLLASVVSIFPDSLKTVVPGGERPLPEGNLMTNAMIDTLMPPNGFTVVFTGGGGRIALAPDALVLRQIDANASNLTPGTRINAGVNNGTAASVYIPAP
jgi:hypothetical protein